MQDNHTGVLAPVLNYPAVLVRFQPRPQRRQDSTQTRNSSGRIPA